MKTAVFLKKSGKVEHVNTFEHDSSEEIINKLKANRMSEHGIGMLDLAICLKNNTKAISIKETMSEEAGVYFIVQGEEKINNFIRDEEWICRVKEEAKNYPCGGTIKSLKYGSGTTVHFVEAQRAFRAGNKKALEKCVTKIRENYPDFVFTPIYW